MPFNKKYFEIAQERLAVRRMHNKQIQEERSTEIYSKIPQYSDLECQLSSTMARIIASIAEHKENSQVLVKQAIEDNNVIQRKMTQLLIDGGYPADYLDPIYTCHICKDKGTDGEKWCECFKKILYKVAAEQINAASPLKLCDFNTFRFDLYSDKPDADMKRTQRQIMQDNFNECFSYAENFNGKGKSIFMIGNTGLGKTHLSLAIANRVIQRGFCVVYGSVPELLRKLDNEQFGKAEGDTMGLLVECDLLILDDLGAENSTDRAVSLLYEIINARQNRNAPLIVNTNLDMSGIQKRYQDRLWSRLFSMRVLLFCGTDNRIKLSQLRKDD